MSSFRSVWVTWFQLASSTWGAVYGCRDTHIISKRHLSTKNRGPINKNCTIIRPSPIHKTMTGIRQFFLAIACCFYVHCIASTSTTMGQLFIGGEFSIVNPDGSFNVDGAHRRAAIQMAVREINNKTDGIYDDILPNVLVKLAVRDGRASFSNTVLQTLDMTNNAFKPHGIHAAIGGNDNFVADAMAGILAGVDLAQIACK